MRCGSCAGIAQSVERPAQKPGIILTRFESPVRQFFSFLLPVNFQCRLCYGIRTALMCSCAPQHPGTCSAKSQTLATMWYMYIILCIVWTHKNPKHWQPCDTCILYYALFGHTKILRTLRGIGSTALAAAVTQMSHKGQRSTNTKRNQM